MLTSIRDNTANDIRLRMASVGKAFGATVALAGVSLEVRAGEVHALVGENGAGKTTLMKVLSGACRADAGEMYLDNQPYQPRNPAQGRTAGVAMVDQELSLAPHLSVVENIMLGVEPTWGPFIRWSRARSVARHALDQLGRSDLITRVPVSRLSPAEQQLVEIARAIAVGCRVLVLDEPTSSLTQRDTASLFALIRRLRAQGLAIVYISHFLEEVREISDRFTVLRDGRSVGGGATADFAPEQIAQLMVGREIAELYPRSKRQQGEAILDVVELAGVSRPQQASLTLHRGEVLGIAGLVGAGRTELLRAIFGLDRVTAGRIRVGLFSGPAKPEQRWRQGVGMVSEERKAEGLALGMSVADNLTLSRLDFGPRGLVMPARQHMAARRWIDRLEIRCRSPWQAVGDLSGGNQQKVALARLLHHDADVLLLDEPTRGIDVASKAEIYGLIDALAVGDPAAGRPPRAVLMVSSYLPELLAVCDRVAVMRRGVLGPPHPVDEVDEHQLMLEAAGAGGQP